MKFYWLILIWLSAPSWGQTPSYADQELKQQANQFLDQLNQQNISVQQLDQLESESQLLVRKLQQCESRAERDIEKLVEIKQIDVLKIQPEGQEIPTDTGTTSEDGINIVNQELERQITAAGQALVTCRLKLSQVSEGRIDILERRQGLWLSQLTQVSPVWSMFTTDQQPATWLEQWQALMPVDPWFYALMALGLAVYLLFWRQHNNLFYQFNQKPDVADLGSVMVALCRIHGVPWTILAVSYVLLDVGFLHLLLLFMGLLLRDAMVVLSLRHLIDAQQAPTLKVFLRLSTGLLVLMSVGLNGIYTESSIQQQWLSQYALVLTPLILITAILTVWVNALFYWLLRPYRDRYYALVLSLLAFVSLAGYVLSYANGGQYLLLITLGAMLVHWFWKTVNWLRKIMLIRTINRLKQKDELADATFVFPFWTSLVAAILAGLAGLTFIAWLAGINQQLFKQLSFIYSEGFEVGSVQVVPEDILIGLIIFTVLIMILSGIKSGIQNRWFDKSRLRKSSREVFSMLVWYAGITVAVFIALTVAGFDISNLAIIAGALSVGIGFGLKEIVSNFVSGLILLFERPVTRGDWVEVGDTVGLIEKVKIRATRIRTFDNAEILVPNSELLSHHVTNWTLSNSIGRITLHVGVAYGSDVNQVRAILDKVAQNHDQVMQREPYMFKVLFREFGDSSLNFELRVMIKDIKKFLDVETELNVMIANALNEQGITIPFPQRDIHIKDASVLKLASVDKKNDHPADDDQVSEVDQSSHSGQADDSASSKHQNKGEVEKMIEEDEKRREAEDNQNK